VGGQLIVMQHVALCALDQYLHCLQSPSSLQASEKHARNCEMLSKHCVTKSETVLLEQCWVSKPTTSVRVWETIKSTLNNVGIVVELKAWGGSRP
jgi:hypothetical protein